ncbi:MAG: DUF4350 domain-containing protein [Pegethrix bostrychoides GSE-TBD4-15B]|jgi:hypothetical protein|uniref:DUF4350 domain-containing protein n=1 Tax=Pegethrix bostrychoides GSE-TBD4-15B TaxID=2839662 RepID=A0A951U7F3_9CYAN|nr:DUF4350 domain-containing protein [Pegethrix bostrychoides GSE-TBD4-15B]
MNLNNRWLWLGSWAVVALLLLTIWAAPQSSQLAGSTYSRAPDGYGAWYAEAQKQKLPVQRWQRPVSDLWPDLETPQEFPPVQQIAAQNLFEKPITLLRVDPRGRTSDINQSWIELGNRLLLLGARPAVTKAPFESALESPVGAVKLATSRRKQTSSAILADQFGAAIWRETLGQGEIIYVATPHLAANAYQDAPGNFKLLTQLVTKADQPIYIDEFLHGYRDSKASQKATENLPEYLAKTPLLLLAVQAIVLVLLSIWGQRRIGRPQPLPLPNRNNSQAYIDAMAEVLQKANSSDFVVQTIGRAEQMRLQQALGLGLAPLSPQAVIEAWVQQGYPASELDWLNAVAADKPRWRDRDLRQWLAQVQTTRHRLE